MSHGLRRPHPIPLRTSVSRALSPQIVPPSRSHLSTPVLWGLALALLGLTVVLWAFFASDPDPLTPLHWVLGVLTGALALTLSVAASARTSHPSTAILAFLAHLSPTALLMTVFPWIADDFAGLRTGDSATIVVVLAVSVTVPWISQSACLPVYESLMDVPRGDASAFYRVFLRRWPLFAGWALLPLAVFTALLWLAHGWGALETLQYAAALATNLLFAQSLIPVTETRRHTQLLAAWACYALALLLAPEFWYLTPLAGLLPPLIQMARSLSPSERMLFREGDGGPRRSRDDPWMPVRLMGRGLAFGSVLWADKFLLLLVFGGQVDVFLVYVSLVPVVVAQAVYYSSQYPAFQVTVDHIYTLVEQRPAGEVLRRTRRLSGLVERTLASTVFIASLAALSILFLAPLAGIGYSGEFLAFLLAPVVFLSLMLAMFHLTQMGLYRLSVCLGLAHLAVAVVALVVVPVVTGAGPDGLTAGYLALTLLDAALAVWSLGRMRRAFASSAYELFWKKATQW